MDQTGYPNRKPEIKFGALQIWAHNREYPSSQDYWDGNWLNVTAHCGGDGSEVWVTGSIIHLSELKTLQKDVERLLSSLGGKVVLDTMEPNLELTIKVTTQNEVEVRVSLTPNHLSQEHLYFFIASPEDLQMLIQELQDILIKYPIIGKSG